MDTILQLLAELRNKIDNIEDTEYPLALTVVNMYIYTVLDNS